MTVVTERAAVRGPDEVLLGFARAVRAAGVSVTADRERTFLQAAGAVGLADQAGVYVAGRATLCASPQDLDRYDQVYAAWWSGEFPRMVQGRAPMANPNVAPLHEDPPSPGQGEQDALTVTAMASATEVLRHRDIAELSAAEKRRLADLFQALAPRAPRKRALRHTAARTGFVDGRATLRDHLRRMGEPGRIRRAQRGNRARRVVLLIDVSGSMSAYADALLRLAHRFVSTGAPVEVFTLGTRLTHVTRALRRPDPDRAIVAAGEAVPDWSGGTRLGQGLEAFLQLWGRRGMARGAVVVLFSDGWERDAPEALGEQMARLSRLAHRVVWVNPHRGKEGFAPVQQGMAAALPWCDDLLAGHSMATFAELTEVVAHA